MICASASIATVLFFSRTATAEVEPATPSYSGTMEVGLLTEQFGTFRQGLPGATLNFSVYNLPASMGTTSPMSLVNTSSIGDSMAIALQTGVVNGLPAGSHAPMQLNLITNQIGDLSVSYRLEFASDSLSGADHKLLAISAYATVLARADYNSDGAVDSLDYSFWRSHFGSNNPDADGNQNGIVDAADYIVWRKDYLAMGGGSSSAEGSALTATFAVPEPASAIFGLLGAGAAGLCANSLATSLAAIVNLLARRDALPGI